MFKTSNNSYTSIFTEENEWTENKLSSMTLREKIAQMIVSYSNGYSIGKTSGEFKRLKRLVQDEKIGGLIFFKGNSVQEADLINELQQLSETPLLISADFERGTGMRLDDGSLFPNNMGIGATRNPELAYKMGLQIAKECRTIGIHQNYAPVMDVNNNADNPIINVRSYGEDPLLVSQMGDMFIKGLQDGNVIATAKHFPGHGDTDIDSHSDLPLLNFDRERLESIELVPFKSAIKNNVMSVMIAHLSFPALDDQPNIPASLSQKIVQDLLIDELHFNGLVVTDALNMKGVTKHFSTQEVAIMCVNAGIDLILMPQGEETTISTIENAVNGGAITEDRIDNSVRKILNAKKWLKLDENKFVNVDNVSSDVNSYETQELSQLIADESITLVKNDDSLIPFKDISDKTCLVVSFNNTKSTDNTENFFDQLKPLSEFASYSYYDITGDVNNPSEILSEAVSFDVVLIPIYARVQIYTGTVGIPQSQIDLINNLVANGKDVIVVSYGNPYLLQGFEGVNSYICAYGDGETSILAALKTIFGKINFKGKLPVSVSNNYPYGTGITN
ncbi:glycoside hydrolase family 3 N-terminal domain-containing protein [Bacteroidota bacterium]